MIGDRPLPASRVFLWKSNGDLQLTSMVMESLLTEFAKTGRPLAVYPATPPFFPRQRGRGVWNGENRFFDYSASAGLEGLRLETLHSILEDRHKRKKAIQEGSNFDPVFLQCPPEDEARYTGLADGFFILANKSDASVGWVYNTVKAAMKNNPCLPVILLILNAAYLEEAAAFYYGLQEEIQSLLQKELSFSFGGFVKIEPGYRETVLHTRSALIDLVPGSSFSGQIRYVKTALGRTIPISSGMDLFSRLAKLQGGQEEKEDARQ